MTNSIDSYSAQSASPVDQWIEQVPEDKTCLPYSVSTVLARILKWVVLPVLMAVLLLEGGRLFFDNLSAHIELGLVVTGALCLIISLIGFLRVNKVCQARFVFSDSGIINEGKPISWHELDHVEVYSEPRKGDKASIVLYLDSGEQIGLRIPKHEVRMKISEVIRRHDGNIAFKD